MSEFPNGSHASLLKQLVDTILRRTDPLPEGGNTIGFVSPTVARKVAEGKFYVVGAGIALGGALSTERPTFRVLNPAGSGKLLYLARLTLYGTVAQQVEYVEDANALSNPVTLEPKNLNRAFANASVVQATHSVVAATGGTKWPNQSRVFTGSQTAVDFPPMVLPPGKSISILGTSSSSQTFTANLYWWEEPLP